MACLAHKLSVTIVLFVFATFGSNAVRAEALVAADDELLRVITYNVQFLPEPVSWKNERPNPEFRAKRIADELRSSDLAGIQEVFHEAHRKQIVERTRASWHGQLHLVESPTPDGFFTSGGCMILSRRPLISSSSYVYKNYSKPADYGQRADGYAAKGVLHARIAHSAKEPTNFIDVYVTHLEARADDLRPLQYKEMAEFIKKTSAADRPMLLLGDLNTYGMSEFRKDPESQYSQLIRALSAARPDGGIIDLWPHLNGDARGGTTEQESSEIGKRIDYIMFGNPHGGKVRLKPKRIAVELYQDEQVGALSDHNAVVAQFEWPSDATPQNDGDKTVSSSLRGSLLELGSPLQELRAYVAARVPKFIPTNSPSDWQAQAAAIRRDMLEKVIFRGQAVQWRNAKTRVEWLDTVPGDADYVIRKFRYEALPGMWFPALLYEPKKLADKVPVFINLNGHDELGYTTPEKQRCCINLAKRGILAFSFEFLYMNQLRDRGNRHNALVQLDLCGTSGVAPFLLALFRGLDVALAHPHADRARVGAAGLSGGGWQTIMLASLDERVALANPVAGHGSIFTRTIHSRDVGDSEQIPTDLCTIADYTHLTALMAPRPLLLTYNAKDDCCFLPAHTLPPLEDAARPTYALFGANDRLRTHINHDPGTHNFERDNREALYRLVRDFFYSGEADFATTDIRIEESKLKTSEELFVPLPPDNATLHSLAVQISNLLPENMDVPRDASALDKWRSAARKRLKRVIRLPHYEVEPLVASESIGKDSLRIMRWKLSIDDTWTIPAVEFGPAAARNVAIVFGDGGRATIASIVESRLAAGERVLAVDPLAFGESYEGAEAMELQMIATVGERPLGIQAAQLAAIGTWMQRDNPEVSVNLVAEGPRASVVALVTAAVEPGVFSEVVTQDSWNSLKKFIHRNLQYKDAPEVACFGLLRQFDIPQLEALAAPTTVIHAAGN